MGKFTEKDLEFIQECLNAEVFQELQFGRLSDMVNGTAVAFCCDGRWAFDLVSLIKSWQEVHRPGSKPFIHPMAWHGGPPRLLPGSTMDARKGGSQVFIDETHLAARITRDLSGNRTLVLIAHGPCGMAGLCQMTFQQVVDELIQTKRFVKRTFPEFEKVVCLVHIAHPDNGEKVYFVHPRQFEATYGDIRERFPMDSTLVPPMAPVCECRSEPCGCSASP